MPETPLRPLMLVGTGSDVGKTLLTAAFCRLLRQEGYQPAPFKAQNMSLNSFATSGGYEISRAQAMQAEAAGISCTPDMNPVLLKPSGNGQSQVILNGKPAGLQNAFDYYQQKDVHEQRRKVVQNAFDHLKDAYNPVVMEGAGSIAELNLKIKDIANMSMAVYANAAVLLVADIDRGGIFGSVYGSLALLPEEEKKLVQGILVNKFRGDIRLFNEGRQILEEITGVPVLGVLPFLEDIYLDEEDSMALRGKKVGIDAEKVNIAVPLLAHISNFTDFSRLERDPRVNVYYARDAGEMAQADIIIIPGSKNTMADLVRLKNNGMAKVIYNHFVKGKTVIGICGGYQMMGRWIEDPGHVEGEIDGMAGMDILPVNTRLMLAKTTEQRRFYFNNDHSVVNKGYEIHMGHTKTFEEEEQPVAQFENGASDGFKLTDRCWGTYIHGILDNPSVIDFLIAPYLENYAENPALNEEQMKEEQYDRLAAMLRKNMDIDKLKTLLRQA